MFRNIAFDDEVEHAHLKAFDQLDFGEILVEVVSTLRKKVHRNSILSRFT